MAKEAQQRKFEEELSRVETVAEGWTFINRIKKNQNSPPYKPPDEALIVHFESLLRGPECNKVESTTRRITAPYLSNEEFLVALSRLKAQGPDGLKAEALIRANHDMKQNTYGNVSKECSYLKETKRNKRVTDSKPMKAYADTNFAHPESEIVNGKV